MTTEARTEGKGTAGRPPRARRRPRGWQGGRGRAWRSLGRPAAPPEALRTLWRVGLVLFGLQLAGLVTYSVHLWRRFDLTNDFATFHQAWEQIATGHLSPPLTTFAYNYPSYGYPFWQSHFELAMWPLALLWYVSHSSLDLLVVQDLALVGAGAVAWRWGLELIGAHWPEERSQWWLGAGMLVALLVNPWVYWTASFDFHFQPIACLFLVAAGRDIWAGRRRAWWWVAGVLACGDVAATYVVALGLGAVLAGQRTRRAGGALVGLGLAWLAVISVVGSGKGSTLAASYGYLATGHVGSGLGGIAAIAGGALHHPGRAWQVAWPRRAEVFKYLASTGTLGVASAVGLPLAIVVLGANALNTSAVFVGAAASFQSLVVVLGGAVGGVMVLTWLARWGSHARIVAAVLGTAMLAQAVYVCVQWTSQAPSAFLKVPAATARVLRGVERRVPATAEVVVSQGVIGRFGGHQWTYPFLDAFANGQTVPVHAATVAFVFTDAGLELASPAQTRAAESFVTRHYHARVIATGAGVEAFLWHPPAGTASITFPPAGAGVP